MIKELKSCPFCGSYKLKLEKKATKNKRYKAYVAFIQCNSCYARGGAVMYRTIPYAINEDIEIPYAINEDIEREAYSRWNRRENNG